MSLSKGLVVDADYSLPVEVKGITNPDRSTIYDRLMKAIKQIRSYWSIRDGNGSMGYFSGPSLVFMAIRNPKVLNCYIGICLWLI